MRTLLADLVQKQTATSLLGVFSRTVDKVVEEMAHDLLRDPEFRAEMQSLVKAAFRQALQDLNQQNDPNPTARS